MDEVLELWRDGGRRIALRACRGSLRALGRGNGGFYRAEDLLQDLFIHFWMLVQRMTGDACSRDACSRDALWQAWRHYLKRGGYRVLRLAPQRLWEGIEEALPREALALDQEPQHEATAARGLSPSEQAQLVQDEDALRRLERIEALDALEASLGRLRPSERQVLYLLALRGLPAEEVARRLRLSSANAVHLRVARARHRLARLMHRPRRGLGNRERSKR